MNEQRLTELLRSADSELLSPLPGVDPGEMAGRVRAVEKKRHRRRVAAWCSTVGIVALLALGFAWPVARRPATVGNAVVADGAAEMDYQILTAEAEMKTQVALRLRAIDVLAQRTSQAMADDPASLIQRERDRAAMQLVADGDRKRGRADPGARACYREVLELFPTSQWAAVAKERLSESQG